MPGFATHYLFGVKTYHTLENEDLKNLIKNNKHVFSLGLQGPDFFFFYTPLAIKISPNIGSTIHKKDTNHFFEEMIKAVNNIHGDRDFEIAAAYVMGFMGHYMLDKNVHPYVYGRVGNTKGRRTLGVHYGLESDIDREILMKFKKMKPAEFSHSGAICTSVYERNVISKLLSEAIQNTYGYEISTDHIKAAINAFYMECALLSDSTCLKHKAIHTFETHVFGYAWMSPLLINEVVHSTDPCNTAHEVWHNPWAENHSDDSSVYDLFDKAKEEYSQKLPAMYEALVAAYNSTDKSTVILKLLGNQSYTTGLEADKFEA